MSQTVTRTVLCAMPRLGGVWTAVEDAVSVPLTRLEASGRLVTEPGLADPELRELLRAEAAEPGCERRRTQRPGVLPSWWRISAAVRAEQARPTHHRGPCPDLCLVTLRRSDMAVLGAAARALGRVLLPVADPEDVAALSVAVADTGQEPGGLVLALARLHGVLDLDLGSDGELLRVLAGVRTDSADARAAHDRVAARVDTMWAAGA